jgi:energy-coupling factor transporter transmembrane protein EcfT
LFLSEKIVPRDERLAALQSSRLWLILFFAVLVLAVFVALSGKRGYALSAFGDLAELSFLLVAAVFMIRNAFASQGATRIFWFFFAAGVVLWIAGLLQWTLS